MKKMLILMLASASMGLVAMQGDHRVKVTISNQMDSTIDFGYQDTKVNRLLPDFGNFHLNTETIRGTIQPLSDQVIMLKTSQSIFADPQILKDFRGVKQPVANSVALAVPVRGRSFVYFLRYDEQLKLEDVPSRFRLYRYEKTEMSVIPQRGEVVATGPIGATSVHIIIEPDGNAQLVFY